ncbi:MAG: CPBP family intramembrane metalloprotease [Candidatus Heimdallarchaeota archaeon]|nr:MAG: CPBP family intramembrane metalloprotease [Candidatus Heimdallarchaeota archaeon]
MYIKKHENKSLGKEIRSYHSLNRLVTAFILGMSIYVGSQLIGIFLTTEAYGPIIEGGNSTKLLLTDLLFLCLSLSIIIFLTRGKITQYGLCRTIGELKWGSIIGIGLIIGSIASILIILTGANGNPSLKSLSIREKILLVWFLASIAEEIFVRGLLQGYLNPLQGTTISIGKQELSYPVIFSTLFFGIIHLPLIFFGADLITVCVIFAMTITLGFFAASLRENHQSVLPSIGIHITTNIGGTMVGPLVYALVIGSI